MEQIENYKRIAEQLYSHLKQCPPETEISVSELGKKVLNLPFTDTDWWAVMDALDKVVAEDGAYRMDYSKHHGLVEGLPFNLDFVFIKKGKSLHAKESRIAKAFAKANNICGVRFHCYYIGWCVFETVSPPGVLVDPAWPPTYIIVDDLFEARWSTEQESENIWKQEQMYVNIGHK